MKYLITILALCLCSACATRKPVKIPSIPAVAGVSRNDMPGVRTPEIVKAYPAGRYTDPDFPDEMHERHTVYRREQSSDWNYRPSGPLGPTVGASSGDGKTDANAQQRAYADALMEQNRAMKARIESMQQEAGRVEKLEKEIERLKKPTVPVPTPVPTPSPTPPEATVPEGEDVFSSVEPPLPVADEISDPCEILLFANSDDECQAFLLSQMRLNDEFAAELKTLERRRRESFFPAPLIRRKEFAFLTKNTL